LGKKQDTDKGFVEYLMEKSAGDDNFIAEEEMVHGLDSMHPSVSAKISH
jgi:hypothetical protein